MDRDKYESILDTAIQGEIEAQRFYAEVASRMQDRSLRELFSLLVEEERHHQKILEEFKVRGHGHLHFRRVPNHGVAETIPAPEVSDAMRPADAFALAMKKEEEAMRRYVELAEACEDEQQRGVFEELAAMEREHKHKMEAAFVSVGYPEVW